MQDLADSRSVQSAHGEPRGAEKAGQGMARHERTGQDIVRPFQKPIKDMTCYDFLRHDLTEEIRQTRRGEETRGIDRPMAWKGVHHSRVVDLKHIQHAIPLDQHSDNTLMVYKVWRRIDSPFHPK